MGHTYIKKNYSFCIRKLDWTGCLVFRLLNLTTLHANPFRFPFFANVKMPPSPFPSPLGALPYQVPHPGILLRMCFYRSWIQETCSASFPFPVFLFLSLPLSPFLIICLPLSPFLKNCSLLLFYGLSEKQTSLGFFSNAENYYQYQE